MTDLHCHILPGIDDGAKDTDISLALLKKEWEDGVRNIALTSHFHFERTTIDEFLSKREEAYRQLLQALAGKPMQFQFKLGAEVFFSPGLNTLDTEKLCIQDTPYMLLEFPTTHRPHFIEETLDSLTAKGIIPIIAHVERYHYAMEDLTLISDWVDAGVYIQVNASSLLKNDKLSKRLLKLIEWKLVHVLSTDTHSTEKRPPQMAEALKMVTKKLGRHASRRLLRNGDLLYVGHALNENEVYYPRKFLGTWR